MTSSTCLSVRLSAKAGVSASPVVRPHNLRVTRQSWSERLVICQRSGKSRCTSRGNAQDKRRRAQAYRSGRGDEWPREDDELSDFTHRTSSFLQVTFSKANNYVARLSQTIIREFSLDVSQEVVSYFIKGVALLTFLTFLKFLLGIFLGIAVLGFFGFFIYKFFLKQWLWNNSYNDKDDFTGGDSSDARYDSEFNPYSSMGDGDEDVIDVRIWKE